MTSARLNCPEDAARRWGHGKVIPRCQIQSHTSTLPLHCINWNCSSSQHESIWMHKVVQHKLYFKVFNGGEVKPPPMKSISDPRFALSRLPPVLRSSVVPLVPTVNNCHNCDRGNIVTWCTHTQDTTGCSIIMFGNLACSTISAWSKDGFYLRRDPRAA